MSKKITCIAIDDEFIALKIITSLIEQTGFLTLLGSYQSAMEGTNAIIELEPDIVFLDVQMPEVSGLDIIKSLNKKPEIILVTSQEKYAVEAFKFDVTDYLVKPIESYTRFMKAVTKAKDNLTQKEEKITGGDAVFMKIDFLLTKVHFESILYVEGYGDYIKVHTTDKTHVVYYKLSSIEERLPKDLFMRVHRSYLVQINKIDNIDQNSLLIGDSIVPVSAKYKPELLTKIQLL
ncbi:LytTR family DNA-binding domain-containing protein [Reichenbachiella carrageenanivorans]|uniref:LytTR family DNA-binding domain-containing protein n=1 Tax=Reichenbachiella carrageenanivorans TaxID=2979869 RepID=A0ABY6D0K6_9BACT|nr:LytTR family DNA-binding domain-containing protein [Reichenbachiella carrageenanivorans]UXX79709.1 LytTR family DNA-binding domain-containing protein [Reichenbachiella carrageenanivorans]